VPDIRWARNDIKSLNLLPKVLMGQRAAQSDVYEALYRDEEGRIWEGTSTNFFVVLDETLVTAPECERILPGLTRAAVLELADELGVEVELRPLTLDDVRRADEAFLTGTLTEVLGLVRVDDVDVGDGDVGPITEDLRAAYLER
ncbi:MAG: aminotransferase class IV, partial [Persicimonas sp.]